MKYSQSGGGYYYKEYKNGKRKRISLQEFENRYKIHKGGTSRKGAANTSPTLKIGKLNAEKAQQKERNEEQGDRLTRMSLPITRKQANINAAKQNRSHVIPANMQMMQMIQRHELSPQPTYTSPPPSHHTSLTNDNAQKDMHDAITGYTGKIRNEQRKERNEDILRNLPPPPLTPEQRREQAHNNWISAYNKASPEEKNNPEFISELKRKFNANSKLLDNRYLSPKDAITAITSITPPPPPPPPPPPLKGVSWNTRSPKIIPPPPSPIESNVYSSFINVDNTEQDEINEMLKDIQDTNKLQQEQEEAELLKLQKDADLLQQQKEQEEEAFQQKDKTKQNDEKARKNAANISQQQEKEKIRKQLEETTRRWNEANQKLEKKRKRNEIEQEKRKLEFAKEYHASQKRFPALNIPMPPMYDPHNSLLRNSPPPPPPPQPTTTQPTTTQPVAPSLPPPQPPPPRTLNQPPPPLNQPTPPLNQPPSSLPPQHNTVITDQEEQEQQIHITQYTPTEDITLTQNPNNKLNVVGKTSIIILRICPKWLHNLSPSPPSYYFTTEGLFNKNENINNWDETKWKKWFKNNKILEIPSPGKKYCNDKSLKKIMSKKNPGNNRDEDEKKKISDKLLLIAVKLQSKMRSLFGESYKFPKVQTTRQNTSQFKNENSPFAEGYRLFMNDELKKPDKEYVFEGEIVVNYRESVIQDNIRDPIITIQKNYLSPPSLLYNGNEITSIKSKDKSTYIDMDTIYQQYGKNINDNNLIKALKSFGLKIKPEEKPPKKEIKKMCLDYCNLVDFYHNEEEIHKEKNIKTILTQLFDFDDYKVNHYFNNYIVLDKGLRKKLNNWRLSLVSVTPVITDEGSTKLPSNLKIDDKDHLEYETLIELSQIFKAYQEFKKYKKELQKNLSELRELFKLFKKHRDNLPNNHNYNTNDIYNNFLTFFLENVKITDKDIEILSGLEEYNTDIQRGIEDFLNLIMLNEDELELNEDELEIIECKVYNNENLFCIGKVDKCVLNIMIPILDKYVKQLNNYITKEVKNQEIIMKKENKQEEKRDYQEKKFVERQQKQQKREQKQQHQQQQQQQQQQQKIEQIRKDKNPELSIYVENREIDPKVSNRASLITGSILVLGSIILALSS